MVTIIHRFQASRWGGTERKDEIGRSPFSADPKPLAHWRGFCWFLINGPNCRNSRMRPYQLCGLSQYNFTTIRVQQYCMYTCKYTTIYSIFFLEELIIYVCICVKVLCIEFLNEWTENNPHLSSSLHLALHSTHHIISVLYPSLIFKNPLLLLGSHSITVNSLMSKYPSLRFFFFNFTNLKRDTSLRGRSGHTLMPSKVGPVN